MTPLHPCSLHTPHMQVTFVPVHPRRRDLIFFMDRRSISVLSIALKMSPFCDSTDEAFRRRITMKVMCADATRGVSVEEIQVVPATTLKRCVTLTTTLHELSCAKKSKHTNTWISPHARAAPLSTNDTTLCGVFSVISIPTPARHQETCNTLGICAARTDVERSPHAKTRIERLRSQQDAPTCNDL
jgi:hypothetical protein